MQVNVTGRHMGVSDALKAYCTEKAQRLSRFLDRIQTVNIIVDGKDGMHTAEMIVHAAGCQPFVASESQEDAFAAIDLLMDKIEAQIRRYKERCRNRKHPPQVGEAPPL